MTKSAQNLLLAISLLLLCISVKAQVLINEFSAANFSQFTDNFGEYEDWIELYNAGNSTVNIGGYFLSDRETEPLKYQIPSGITISPNDHLRIWASGNDTYSGGHLHTNFKITQTRVAEMILLSDNTGMLIDTHAIDVPNLKHHSWGRTTDGGPNWGVLTSPTPNNTNTNVKDPYATRPEIMPAAGFYGGSVTVTITSPDPGVTLYYTTDGSEPNTSSNQYSGPFNISITTVIKAVAVSSNGNIPDSHLDVHTFFVDDVHTIPVVSISGDNLENLLNGSSGLEPEGYFEFFNEAGERKSDSSGEFNKHGNDSWAYPQRGIDYIARDQFGDDYAIKHKIFPDKDRDRFQRVMLKAAANDNYPFGNGAHIRDAYIQQLSHNADLELDERTNEPCIVYLNGEYWGVYEIREKVDDPDFTKYYYDQGRQWIDYLKTWGNTWAEYGSGNDWFNLRDFIVANDMSNTANYSYVSSEMNVLSLIDYMIINTHTVCKDWLNWNTSWWRGNKPSGGAQKWRYSLWDMDATFGHYINYTGIPDVTPYADPCDPEEITTDFEGHVDMLVSLLDNDEFFALYINRYADLNNTYLGCDYMIQLLDDMINRIDPEMPEQINRWGGNYGTWLNEVQEIRDFILIRCDVIDDGIVDCYDVDGPYEITIDVDPPNSGTVQVNDITSSTYPWDVTYFGGVPVTLIALPNPGFQFSHWTLNNNTLLPDNNTADVTTDLISADYIVAHFVPEGCNLNPLISGVAELCAGEQTVLTVTPAFDTYLWSDNSATQSITVNFSGDYSVTVSDNGGCSATTTYTLGEAPSPTVQIVGDNIFCENDFTILDAGPNYTTYLWSDNSTEQELVVTETGNYTVTVSNVEGCTAEDELFVDQVPLPVPNIEGDAELCEGSTGVLFVENIYISYLWSDGTEDPEIVVTEGGIYSVTVVDQFGCEGYNTYNLPENPAPTPQITGDEMLCANATGLLDGGANYTTYLWSDNTTNQTLNISSAGTYALTVTNAEGCTGATSIEVTQNAELNTEITGELTFCQGTNTVLSLSESFSAYLWSDNSTNPTLAVTTPGFYNVTVTDALGCTGTDEAEVVENPEIIAEIIGDFDICAEGNTVLSLTENYVEYLWNDGTSEPELFVDAAGYYSVEVTDEFGCTGTTDIEVIQYNEVVPEIIGELDFCVGSSAILILSEDYTSYLWSDNSTDETLEVFTPGFYSVEVTDAFGCTGVVGVDVAENPTVNAVIEGELFFCNEATSILSLTESYTNYIWSDNSTNTTLEVEESGMYSVTVTNTEGCTGEQEVEVIQNIEIIPEITGDFTFCQNLNTTLSVSETFTSYLWSDNSTEPTLEVNETGTYVVIVTDAFGCTGQINVAVTELDELLPELIGSSTFCEGSSSLLSLSETYDTYLWSDNSTSPTLDVTQSGTYEVEVTDSEGCTGIAQMEVIESDEIDVQITGDLSFCNGTSTIISPSQTYASYLWNDNSSASSLEVNSPGFYSVIVTDDQGCTGTTEVEVTENDLLQAEITGDLEFCPESSSILSLSETYDNYLWSDNSSDPTLEISSSGIYAVVVTDAEGCTAEAEVEVTETPEVLAEITGNLDFCAGTNTTLSLTETYESYQWSDNSTDPTLEVSSPGSYSVVVTSVDGCTAISEVEVIENELPSPEINGSLTFCEGSSTTLSLPQTYSSYQWSDNSTSSTLEVTTPGDYSVIITDAAGCTGTAEVEVQTSDEIEAEIIGSFTFCEGNTTILSLSQTYSSYQWNDNTTNSTLEVASPGSYSVIITDASGCTGTVEVEVTEDESPLPEINGLLTFCEGTSTTLSLSQTYSSYQWSDNSTNSTLEVTTPGAYSVIVTDASGCTGTTEVEVQTNDEIEAEIIGSLTFCEGSSTTLSLSQTYSSYQWSDNSTNSTLEVTTPGAYSVIITDASGCTGTAEVEVQTNDEIEAEIIGTLTFCEGSSTILSLSQTYTSYQWSDNSSNSTLEVTTPGAYNVIVTDTSDCTSTAEVEITVDELPSPEINGLLIFCEGSSTTLSLSQTYSSYQWSDNSTNSTLEVFTPGAYSVIITDASGCTGTAEVEVETNDEIEAVIIGSLTFCEGSSTILSLSQTYSSYQWSDNSTNNTLEVTMPGFYSVIITDDSGCTGAAEVEVQTSDDIDAQIVGSLTFCEGSSTILSLSQAYASYQWSDNSTNSTLEVTTPGAYSVVITDASGCTGAAEVEVQTSDDIDAQIVGSLTFCEGSSTILSLSQAYASYQWSDNSTNSTLEVTSPGAYSVIIIDAAGCTGTAEVEVQTSDEIEAEIIGSLLFCEGSSTMLSLSQIYTSYQWSDNSTNSTLEVTTPGSYSVIITDAAGCTGTTEVEVQQSDEIEAQIVGLLDICEGSSTILSLSEIYGSYQWSNNSTSESIEVSATGVYDVIVTDLNGCTGMTSAEVNLYEIQSPEILGPLSFCEGSTAGLLVEDIYAAYQWSNGWNGNELLVTESGTYEITVTDGNGCTATDAFEINTTDVLETMQDIQLCFGESLMVGSSTYSSSGSYEDALISNDGCDSIVFTILEIEDEVLTEGAATICYGGLYEGIVYAQSTEVSTLLQTYDGCDSTHMVALTVLPELVANVYASAYCSEFGTVGATTFGGAGDYTYLWSNGTTEETLNNVPEGTYSVTITDSFGCTTAGSGSFIAGTGVDFEYEVEQIVCNGDNNASIITTVVEGTPPFAYTWSNGATSAELSNVGPGTYTLLVTDAGGCNYASTIEVLQPDVLLIDPITTGTLDNDGTATAVVTGGTTPYTYEWSTGHTSASISGLSIGFYDVTVTDENGCTATATAEVSTPTSNNEIKDLANLQISPNPGTGLFRLQMELRNPHAVNYKIYDLQGRMILSAEHSANTIFDIDVDLQLQPSAIYLMVIEVEGQRIVKRLLVQR